MSAAAPRAFPVAAIILGAGAGTRFGEPKAGATLPDGRRFVDAVAATARDAGCEPVVAVLPPGMPAPAHTVAVVNADARGEQVASLRAGLMRLANTPCIGAFVWPVDHPFVTLETLLAVLDAAQRTGAPIVRPEYGTTDGVTHGHPVFFHRDTWRELMTVPEGGARAVGMDYGARAISVPVRDAGVARNIDTRADLAG